jgi:hypothetical protein
MSANREHYFEHNNIPINVKDMRELFQSCDKITDIESSLANWNVSKVKNIYDLFLHYEPLMDVSSLSNWDVSDVKDTSYMFNGCNQIQDITPLANENP